MRRILIILIIPCLLSFQSSTDSYSFIGYRESSPVFFNVKNGDLVLRNSHENHLIANYISNRKPVFISEELIVVEYEENERLLASISNGKEEKVIPLKSKMTYISGDNHKIFYTNLRTSEIIMLSMNGEQTTNLKGNVVGFENECLYITQEHDPEIISANADVYKIDANNLGTKEKVANNISGENVFVLPKGNHIYDQILFDGEYRPCIFDVSSGNFALIDVPNEFRNQDCYYSYESESIEFYNPASLSVYTVNMPSSFMLKR